MRGHVGAFARGRFLSSSAGAAGRTVALVDSVRPRGAIRFRQPRAGPIVLSNALWRIANIPRRFHAALRACALIFVLACPFMAAPQIALAQNALAESEAYRTSDFVVSGGPNIRF
jgi:hypothetical protein